VPRPQTVRPEHILACAADLLEQHGFEGVTTRAVAQAAGVSEGTLFRYFKSKDALFTAALMVRAGAPEFFELLRSLVAGRPDDPPQPMEALDQLSRAALSFYLTAVHAIAVLAVRGAPIGEPEGGRAGVEPAGVQRGPAAAHALLAEYFRRLAAGGVFTDGDEKARAAGFLGGLFGYAFTRAVLDGDERAGAGWQAEPECFRQQFVADFVRGVSAGNIGLHSTRG